MCVRRLPRVGALAALAAVCIAFLVLLVLLLAGRGSGQAAHPAAIRLIDGVPVGVHDTRAGALAAAENYVALGSQELEQDPAGFAALVAQTYLASTRGQALSEARLIRTTDVQDMRNYSEGGHGIALVAAGRLDRYTPASAATTTWLAGVVWGPNLAPRQTWNLVETSLAWHDGRWLVASSRVAASPAPAPAIVYVQGENDRAGVFEHILAGMSAPLYGTAEK